MRYLTASMFAILLAGCAPTKGSPAYFMEKQRQVLYAQCLREHLPRSYGESQFDDKFSVANARGEWACMHVYNSESY